MKPINWIPLLTLVVALLAGVIVFTIIVTPSFTKDSTTLKTVYQAVMICFDAVVIIGFVLAILIIKHRKL